MPRWPLPRSVAVEFICGLDRRFSILCVVSHPTPTCGARLPEGGDHRTEHAPADGGRQRRQVHLPWLSLPGGCRAGRDADHPRIVPNLRERGFVPGCLELLGQSVEPTHVKTVDRGLAAPLAGEYSQLASSPTLEGAQLHVSLFSKSLHPREPVSL